MSGQQSEIQILLTAKNQAQAAFAEFSKAITDVASNLLKSADASGASAKAQTDGATAATTSASAHRDLSAAVTDNTRAHSELTDVLGPFVSKYLEARTIFGLAREAYSDYTEFLRSSIEAYADAEAAEVRLAAALQAQGDASPALVARYSQYADELEQTTTVSRTAALQAEATFATIGNVGPDMMARAITAAADYSAATGKSFESSALIIAKAAEGNVSALQRFGIQISKSQVDLDGMGVVFDAIEEKMGGQSAALTGTLLGSWEQMGNQWTRAKEQLGGELAPVLETGVKLLSGLIGIVSESPDAFAAFVIGSTAVAASLAWIGLADLFSDKLSRMASLIGGPLTQNVSLFATENAVAQGSVLGLSGAEAILETETVGVTGSILGLSGAAGTAAVAEDAAATSTLALASAAGLAQLALGALVVIPLSVMAGEWIGKITGLTDAIQHWVGASGDAELKAQTLGAQQDTVNRAVAEGAPVTISYGDAVKYLSDQHAKAAAGGDTLTESTKRFTAQVDTVVESVIKAANSGEVMNQAFTMLNDHGLANSTDTVSKLWPQVQKLMQSGADLAPEVLDWYHAWATFMASEADTKRFESAVQSMSARLVGDAGPSIKVVAEAFRELTPAQRESSDTTDALTPIVQKFLDKGITLPPVLQAWADAHDVVSKAQQRHQQAMDELAQYTGTYREIVADLDPQLVAQVERYLSIGASVSLVSKAFSDDLSPAQVKAIDDMVKANTKYVASWQTTSDAIAKIWDDAYSVEQENALRGLDLQIARLNKQQQDEADAAAKRIKDADQLQQALMAIQAKYDALRGVAVTKNAQQIGQQTQQLWTQYYDTIGAKSASTADYQIAQVQRWYDNEVEKAIAAGNTDTAYYTALSALADAKMQEVYNAHNLAYQGILKLQTDLAGGWQQSFVSTIESTGSFAQGFESIFTTLKSDVEGIFAAMLASVIQGFLKPLLDNVSSVASSISNMLISALTGNGGGGSAVNFVTGGGSVATPGGGLTGLLSSFLGGGGGAFAGIGASEAIGGGAAVAAGAGVTAGGIATGGLIGGDLAATATVGNIGALAGADAAGTAAAGGGFLSSLGALATNPWTIGIAGAAAGIYGLYQLFSSGPSDQELAGRAAVAQWESDVWAGLSDAQKSEASAAGWANPQDAGALIWMRTMYTNMGRKAPETSAENYMQNVYGAQTKGASGVVSAIQDVGSFGGGGVVPGPLGAPARATVHGGETIRTPAQEAALSSPSGDLVIHHAVILDGKTIDAYVTRIGKKNLQGGQWTVPARSVVRRAL